MRTRKLETLSAAIEFATGLALIATPDVVARVLLGTDLSEGGVAVGRVAGCGLLSLGIACWPGGAVVTPQSTRALFAYNLLVAFYLGYVRATGDFLSHWLWPACALHAVLAVLLARPAYDTFRAS